MRKHGNLWRSYYLLGNCTAATLRQKRTPPLFSNNGFYQPPLFSPLNPERAILLLMGISGNQNVIGIRDSIAFLRMPAVDIHAGFAGAVLILASEASL